MWQTLKPILVQKIVQWILKVASGVLVTLGVSQGSLTEIVTAVVTLVVGVVWSLVTNKKVSLTDPNTFNL